MSFFFSFLKSFQSPPLSNRPPLPPHVTNQQNHHQQQHQWENGSSTNSQRRTDSFANSSPQSPTSLVTHSTPSPFSIQPQQQQQQQQNSQFYPHGVNQSPNTAFINQAQVSGLTPIRRPVPMPGNIQSNTMRNMSASAFNLNQNIGGSNGYPNNNFQQAPNPWGFSTMNQVSLDTKNCDLQATYVVKICI